MDAIRRKARPTDEEIRHRDALLSARFSLWTLRLAMPLIIGAFILGAMLWIPVYLLGYRWRRSFVFMIQDFTLMARALYSKEGAARFIASQVETTLNPWWRETPP